MSSYVTENRPPVNKSDILLLSEQADKEWQREANELTDQMVEHIVNTL